MFRLELKIFDRQAAAEAFTQSSGPADDAAMYFMRSYLGMRYLIGLVAFVLPWLLVAVDWLLLPGSPQIRHSMSAYYHSPARDLFVGGLVATGGFLVSYMAAKPRTYDFWLSTCAGVLVWVVAACPTGRALEAPQFAVSADSCVVFPGPPACNGIQQAFGESAVRTVHGISAGLFVALLAVQCGVFAVRQFGYGPGAEALCAAARDVRSVRAALAARQLGVTRYLLEALFVRGRVADAAVASRRRVVLYGLLSVVIVLSGAWAFGGFDLLVPFTSLRIGRTYLGEVTAFTAFGVAWMLAGRDLAPNRPAVAADIPAAGAPGPGAGTRSPGVPGPRRQRLRTQRE